MSIRSNAAAALAVANPRALVLAGTSAAMLGITSWLHVSVFGRRVLEKFPPDWSSEGAARTAGCLIAAILFALALRQLAGPVRTVDPDRHGRAVLAGTSIVTIALLIFTIAVMAAAPQTMIDYVAELRSIAILQEVMIAGATALAALTALLLRGSRHGRIGPFSGALVVSAMSLTLLILLMEETSFGQHYLGWATPDQFAANIQNETNLHNFYTYRFELVFYSAAMLAFVILPAAWPNRPPPMLAGLGFYVPPRAFALLGLPVCAFLYNGWNIVPLQAGFFLAVAIGVIATADLWRAARPQALFTAAIVGLLIMAQATIFGTGHLLVEHYETDEIRETHIALLCLAYAGWLFAKVRSTKV